ncbi:MULTISPECIES: PilX N-terminal domain-containing pilus assembly protein [unclassified Thioalkalivibrio]|uniref:pilus assembly PilX family protein n=1 Tax=unclassified Thioalkalivibrio TaxID=2621013 RepID=UPI00037FCAA7|nr:MULTISPECIES: PilX N-terminal domain-containing pilus assembly protein [unclassified Thioalkalivibrio]
MNHAPFTTPPARQRGLATLVVALIIMVAVTLTVLFTAQTSILEERMAANETRMKQTTNAAQAGLERAVVFAQDGEDDISRLFEHDYSTDRPVFYRSAFISPDAVDEIPGCPDSPDDFQGVAVSLGQPESLRNAGIWSCGWSDDQSARRGVTTTIRGAPSLADPPTNPLTTRGGVNTNGRARVFNAYNNLTIWSGQDLDVTGNPGNTFVRNQDHPPLRESDPLPSEPAQCGVGTVYVCTTDANMRGPDVITGDLQLSSLSDDDFFRNFMGQEPNSYRDNVVTQLDPDSIDGMTNEVIWMTGDVDLNDTVGNRDNPVVLVVEGDATLSGNFELHGVLYVRGNLSANGTPTVYGASVIQGDTTDAGGTPYFVFDPVAASGAGELGARGAISGAWRDWAHWVNE